MKAEILFYKTKQTEINRPLLEAFLSQFAFTLERISGASSPEQLVKHLGEAVVQSRLVLISGGLDLEGKENIKNVLSAALHLPLFKKREGMFTDAVLSGAQGLKNRIGGVEGVALRQGEQILILLPESSQELETVLDSAGEYLEKQLGITPQREKKQDKKETFLQKDAPEDIRAILEPNEVKKNRIGTGRRVLVVSLSILAFFLFLFLVYKIYFRS